MVWTGRKDQFTFAFKLYVVRKLVFTTVLFFLFAFMGRTQAPGGKPGAGAKPGAPPAIGRAYGKVTDTAGQPMADVSAILLKSITDTATKKKKLVLVKGMETKANGEFNFEDLPIVTQLVLRVSATGYKSKDLPFMIMPAAAAPAPPAGQAAASPYGNIPSFEKDLGVVKLSGNVQEMSAAVVTAKPPVMKLELDKKVFNVERNIVSAGGTALDVMRNVPSVNVDIDGNVSLRGATPTIEKGWPFTRTGFARAAAFPPKRRMK